MIRACSIVLSLSLTFKMSASKKVVMCRFANLGCPVPNCGYAHKPEELTAIMCKHGDRCMFDRRRPNFSNDKRPCGMFHPGEDTSTDSIYKRALEFGKPYELKELLNKSSVCNMAGCKRENCTFAHNADEICIPYCVFGKYCPGYGKCRFEHNYKMTKKEYFDRRCRIQKLLTPEQMSGLFVIKANPQPSTAPEVKQIEEGDDVEYVEEIIEVEEEEDEQPTASFSLSNLLNMIADNGVKPRPVPQKPVEPEPVVEQVADPNAAFWSDEKIARGQQLYPLIAEKFPNHAAKITGMLLELSHSQLDELLVNRDELNRQIIDALSLLL